MATTTKEKEKVTATQPASDPTQDKLAAMSYDTGADTCIAIEGSNLVWSSAKDIVSCEVQLGMDDKASTVTFTVADISVESFEKLINHSLKNGGISALSSPSSPPNAASGTNTTPLANGTSQNLGAPPGGLTAKGQEIAKYLSNPGVMAAIDTIAYAELGEANWNKYNIMVGGAEFNNGYKDHPRQPIQYGSDAAGRYQFISTTWDGFRAKLGLPDFSPMNQTLAAISYMEDLGVLQYAAQGNWAEFTRHISPTAWASLATPEHASYQPNPNGAWAVTSRIYAQQFAKYNGGIAPKIEATPVQTGNGTDTTNTAPQATPIIKGNKIYVYHKGFTYTYYHQGTDHDAETGKLTLKGTGVRYAIDQRKRNGTQKNISLKEFASKVATTNKLKLDWQADHDVQFDFIDQSGVSDLQRLKQECKKAGLFIGDVSSSPAKPGDKPAPTATLTIKSLINIKDTAIVLQRGNNLISAKMADEPLDGGKVVPDNGSSLLQPESKTVINPISSTVEQKIPDIDSKKSTDVSGAKSPPATATPKPGQEVIANQQAGRVKRVQGLPSTFTVFTTDEFLALEPLSAIRTKGIGFPGILERVWMVSTIKHDFMTGITELKCFSPIEVIDLSPPQSATPGQPPANIPPGTGYIIPCNGYVSSPYGWRVSTNSFHCGIDIGGDGGDDVVASDAGVVKVVSKCGDQNYGNYGNAVDITHANGDFTRYGHLLQTVVSPGQQVQQGQKIGVRGGYGEGCVEKYAIHLHFEIHKGGGDQFGKGSTVDPASLIQAAKLGNPVKIGMR